jgi:Bacteriophage probable baseplate hub protein
MAAPSLRFAPEFRVRIEGRDIPAALRSSITSVRYQDGTGAADRVELGIANVDLRWLQQHIRGLGFQPFPTGIKIGPVRATPSDGLFDVDNTLELSLGYAQDALEDVFKGDITGVQATFPSGGMPTMTIVAHDYLHRLSEGKYARGFGPLPDALIARILSLENLLIPIIDPTIDIASTAIAVVNFIFGGTGRKQKAQSDLELLQELSAAYDADFWVDGDILYVARFFPKEYSSRLTLRWGESLLDFSPKVSTVGQVAAAAMKFTLREIPLSFLVNIFWDFDKEAIGIVVIPGEAAAGAKAIVGPTYTIVDQPIKSPADIANSALAIYRELRQKLNNRLTGSGSAVGDPRIRAGAVITLDGLGPDFSGVYRVTSATHSLDSSGYRTSFEVRKEILP